MRFRYLQQEVVIITVNRYCKARAEARSDTDTDVMFHLLEDGTDCINPCV